MKNLGVGMLTDEQLRTGDFVGSIPRTEEELRVAVQKAYGRYMARARTIHKTSNRSAKIYTRLDKLSAMAIITFGIFISFLAQVGDCVNWWVVGFGCSISFLEGIRNLLTIGGKGVKFKAISIRARKLYNMATDLLESNLRTAELKKFLDDLRTSLDELEFTDFKTGEAKDIKYSSGGPEMTIQERAASPRDAGPSESEGMSVV